MVEREHVLHFIVLDVLEQRLQHCRRVLPDGFPLRSKPILSKRGFRIHVIHQTQHDALAEPLRDVLHIKHAVRDLPCKRDLLCGSAQPVYRAVDLLFGLLERLVHLNERLRFPVSAYGAFDLHAHFFERARTLEVIPAAFLPCLTLCLCAHGPNPCWDASLGKLFPHHPECGLV